MRSSSGRVGSLAIACALLVACGGGEGNDEAAQKPSLALGAGAPGVSPEIPDPRAPAPPAAAGATATTHPEVVQLVMAGKDGATWFCTATLVSSTVAVTAAHCLQPDLFISWQVIAPGLKGRPRAEATPAMYDGLFNQPAHPDLGVVVLATPITLAHYAVLTDVSAQIDGGQALDTRVLVRTNELPEAPLVTTDSLRVTSTASYGYLFGYGVPQYSHGGDSGAGLFLVENAQMTHKVIAVEREPDPDRGIDHLSRVDAAFIAWVADPARAAAPPPPPVAVGGGKKKGGGQQ